ncbi:MAG: VanZ family protein [Cellvibrionaceae bacterium]
MQLLSRLQLIFLLAVYLYLGTIKISDSMAASMNDLLAHCLGYIILMCSGFFAFPARSYTTKLFILFFLFSFLVECIQYFLPYRSFSLLDLLANGVGLILGVGMGWLLLPAWKQIRGESRVR